VIDEMRPIIIRAAALTTRDIAGGLLLAAGAGTVFDALATPLPVLPVLPRRILAAAIAIVVLFQAMKLWGRDMTRLAHQSGPGAISRGGAFFLAVLIGMTGFMLGVTEPFVVGRAALRGMQIHEVYMLLFVTVAWLVPTAGTYTLGRGLYRNGFATKLAAGSGIAAAAAFLAVALTMDALGWRVGAPGAAKRATMIVVTTLGLLAASAVAGGVVGMMISRVQGERAQR
jgi:hypothetical protein